VSAGICRIIGVLDDGCRGLSAEALAHLACADLVIAGGRLLQSLADSPAAAAERWDLTGRLPEVAPTIARAQAAGRNVVVLATGDPLCHGIGGMLYDRLPAGSVQVLPNVSMLQLACARLGVAWQDARIASAHGRDAGEWRPGADPSHGLYPLLQQLRQAALTLVLTSPANSPDRIARMLRQENLVGAYRMAVASRLSRPDESVSGWLSVDEAAGRTFAEPNVLLLRRQPCRSEALFGLADHCFQQRKPDKGLITKREVRAVALARLALKADSIVWDIGAGSGSVGLEAARLCPAGHVYAVEKNPEDAANAWANKIALRVSNYSLLQAKAPDGLAAWPDPDAVFIGGSGGELPELIGLCLARLRPGAWLVMSFATLENLAGAIAVLKRLNAVWDASQLQASRSKAILDMHRLQAENPVWLVCAQNGQAGEAGDER